MKLSLPPPPPPPHSPRPTSPYDCHLLPSRHSEAEALKDGAVRVIAEIDIFKCDSCVSGGEVECGGTRLFLQINKHKIMPMILTVSLSWSN